MKPAQKPAPARRGGPWMNRGRDDEGRRRVIASYFLPSPPGPHGPPGNKAEKAVSQARGQVCSHVIEVKQIQGAAPSGRRALLVARDEASRGYFLYF